MGNKLQFPTTPFINEDTENMKTFLTTMAFALCCLSVTAKPASKRVAFPGGKYKIYRVALQDKRGNDYSLKHPERFLAERALQRRSKQELAVDSTDLPISRKYLKKLAANGFTVIGGSKWNNGAGERHQRISKSTPQRTALRDIGDKGLCRGRLSKGERALRNQGRHG